MKKSKNFIFNEKNYQIKIGLLYNQKYDTDFFEKAIFNSLEKIVNFYGDYKKFPNEIFVELIYSRDEYDKILGRESKKNNAGYYRDLTAIVFHPDFMEKETVYEKSYFSKVLTHEISHIFTRFIFKNYLWWVTEGVAQVLAGQSLNKTLSPDNVDNFIEENFYQNTDYLDFVKKQGHQISKQLMFKIQKKLGDKTLFNLLTIKSNASAKEKISYFLDMLEQDIDLTVKKMLFNNCTKKVQ